MAAHSWKWSLRLTTGETVESSPGRATRCGIGSVRSPAPERSTSPRLSARSGNLIARWRRDRQLRQSTLFGAALFGAAALVGSFNVQSVGAEVPIAAGAVTAVPAPSQGAVGGSSGSTPARAAAVRPVQSPCKALRGQHKAAIREVKAKTGTRAVLTDVEAAATIAKALYAECGWED